MMPNDVAADCNGTMSRTGYYGTAVPLQVSSTGQRAFSTAAAGTIYFDQTGAAPTGNGRHADSVTTRTRKTTHEEVPENGHLFVFQDVVL